MTEAALLRALMALINEARNTRLTFTDETGATRSILSYDLALPLHSMIAKKEGF